MQMDAIHVIYFLVTDTEYGNDVRHLGYLVNADETVILYLHGNSRTRSAKHR